jgi:hypothetical protein
VTGDAAMIENLRPLTQEQRQGARKSARDAVIRSFGPKPTREQLTHTSATDYPSVTITARLRRVNFLSQINF